MDKTNRGLIVPKGNLLEVTPLIDGRWQLDGKMNLGPSEKNAARAQQIESGLYSNRFVSTTRSESIAIRFATSNYIEPGYVYVINELLLEEANIRFFEFNDPKYPGEREVSLASLNGIALPEKIIIEKYEVDVSGSKR
jgi:hypothetical protein